MRGADGGMTRQHVVVEGESYVLQSLEESLMALDSQRA